MFILAPNERHLEVKTDINATQIRIGLHSGSLGKGNEISAFDRAAEPSASNNAASAASKVTGIY